MKKSLLLLLALSGTLSVNAQKYLTKKKKSNDHFAVVVKDSEKDKIDWNGIKEYFQHKKASDSVKISIKVTDQDYKNLKSEAEYTLWGKYEDLNKMVDSLKKMITD